MSQQYNSGQNHTANKSLENIEKFEYLGTTVTKKKARMKKLGADNIQELPVTICSRTYPLICCLKSQRLKYTELQFCLLFFMVLKLDLSH
jgi:hypothetical protein